MKPFLFRALLPLFVAAVTLLFLTQCDKSDLVKESDITFRTIENPYDYVGVQHNIALDTIYSWILLAYENNEIDNMSTQSEVEDVIVDLLLNYRYKFTADPSEYEMLEDASIAGYGINPSETDTNLIVTQGLQLNGSEQYESLVADLNYLFTYDDTNYVLFNNQLNNLVEEALELEDSTELKILCSMISVAKHSSDYWLGNYEKWDDLFATISLFSNPEEDRILPRFPGWGPGPYPPCPHCKRLAGADAGAAGLGGIIGGMTGGFVSVGALTLPGWGAGAVIGAAGGSLAEAWNIFKEWWN